MLIVWLLVLLFLLPIMYSLATQAISDVNDHYRRKHSPDAEEEEEEEEDEPTHTVQIQSSHHGRLTKANPNSQLYSTQLHNGDFPVAVRRIWLWADLSQVDTADATDVVQLMILTNSPASDSEYISILTQPITISPNTPSRILINVSAHVSERHRLTRDSVLLVKRQSARTLVDVPTLLTLELSSR